MIGVAVVVLLMLWRWIDSLALADVEKKATAHLDAVKVAASIAVGGGGLFALYLAARRQRTQELELDVRHDELAQRDRVQTHTEQVFEINRVHAERVAAASERDAADRRITELYAKSVEQLGSDKAPVRLGGLYALERLAQDNPDQRPTVVNVLCAYLRMPYPWSVEQPGNDADERILAKHSEHVQERQVRLTAQRILTTHLRPDIKPGQPADTFWPDTELNLTGATLIDFSLNHCRLRTAEFNGATFAEGAWFNHATVTNSVWFNDATFTEVASLVGATFNADVWFMGTTFTSNAWFEQATFAKIACFNRTKFNAKARFGKTTFRGDCLFVGTTFTRDAYFDGTMFAEKVVFAEALPSGHIHFNDALARHGSSAWSPAASSAESAWPDGWRQNDEHDVVKGFQGTWHRFTKDRSASLTMRNFD